MNGIPVQQIDLQDNVAVAVETLPVSSVISLNGKSITVTEEVPPGHKVALQAIAKGKNVIKYGYPIGHAKVDIAAGQWVNEKNVGTNLAGTLEYRYTPNIPALPKPATIPTFEGYVRSNGEVGIRNEIWIIPTVGCVNQIAEKLAQIANQKIANNPNVQGAFTFAHPYGCSQLGDDHEHTRIILADLVKHPNAGGVLVIGLGCENNTPDSFQTLVGNGNDPKVKFLVAQKVSDELEEGTKLLDELISYASKAKRETVSATKLRIGLKCGASDGFSGITANPLIGSLSDRVVALGGTTILTEVPEMFGAEQILMNRCEKKETFDLCVKMINGFKEYFLRYNQPVHENPSPGNKAGGISTLEDKSLGCTQKGGTAPVTDVLDYGDRLKKNGLNLLQGPGNDIVSTTALTAAGCQMVLFSTGRGTPLGCPVPTVKVSSNGTIAKLKPGWIDFNAGQLLDGVPMDKLTDEFLNFLLDVASGKKQTRNEINGFREIAIFKDGVTL